MIELTAREARRIAVRAQRLDAPRPTSLLDVARHLGAVQVDLTAYVAPSAELVFWSRLGGAFTPDDLTDALEARAIVEHRGFLRPAEDMRLFTAEMAAYDEVRPPGWHPQPAQWVADNDHAREEVLQALRTDGPLTAREIDVPFRRDWRSSGWNNTKNVPMMLERLEERGEVAVSHRAGRERVWDLADRIYPDDDPVPVDEARRIRAERRLASLGVARATGPACSVEPMDAEAGVEARIEGLRGVWRVDPDGLRQAQPSGSVGSSGSLSPSKGGSEGLRQAQPSGSLSLSKGWRGRTALLSPLDRLVFDRKRMTELFEFDYALEMYKPAAQRKWGYYALPVLHGDRLVGKVDAEADRRAGVLVVHARHEDEPWSATVTEAVETQLRSLAKCLSLDLAEA